MTSLDAEELIKELILTIRTINHDKLVSLSSYLSRSCFFVSPASTKFHGCFKGGLAVHSLNVYRLFKEFSSLYELNVSEDDIIICGLLHDICKCGAYIDSGAGYFWNKSSHPSRHGKLSVSMLESFIPLSKLQKEIILYHMGMYGVVNPGSYINEYSLTDLLRVFSNNIPAKVFSFCDELATIKEKLATENSGSKK